MPAVKVHTYVFFNRFKADHPFSSRTEQELNLKGKKKNLLQEVSCLGFVSLNITCFTYREI